jgi:hypothetical protein
MEDTDKTNMLQKWKVLKTAGVVGVYSVAGIYIARWLRGSSAPISTNDLAFAAGTSAVAAWGAPMVVKMVSKEDSDIEPFLEAGASAALTWPVMYWASGSSTAANMFLPIQAVSHLTGSFAVSKWRKWQQGITPENLPGKVGSCGIRD